MELERRLNQYKSSGFNPFPAAQETLSGIEKTLYKTKDLLSDRFWINIADQKNGVVRQEEAPQKSDIASQKNGVFRQEETPPKFDSQNEHWHNFIRLFETVAELNEWSDSVKAGKLILSMQGHRSEICPCAAFLSIRGDFGNLKNLLEQYFDPVERRETAFFEFQSRTHRSDESLQEYFQEMMDLAYRAFPDIPDVTLSGQVINRFIQGLQTSECRKHVKFSKPKSLYDALKYAVSYEIFDTFDKDPKLPMVENHQRTPKAVPIHVTSTTSKSGNESRPKISTDSTHKKISTISGSCWNCSESGHRSVECPKPRENGGYDYQPGYAKRRIPWNALSTSYLPVLLHFIPCRYYNCQNTRFQYHPGLKMNFMPSQGKSTPRFPGAAHAG